MHLGILVLASLTNPMTDQARIRICGQKMQADPDNVENRTDL